MPLSKRQKRMLRKLRHKRAIGDLPKYCSNCGVDIHDSIHHYYCRKCWVEKEQVIKPLSKYEYIARKEQELNYGIKINT